MKILMENGVGEEDGKLYEFMALYTNVDEYNNKKKITSVKKWQNGKNDESFQWEIQRCIDESVIIHRNNNTSKKKKISPPSDSDDPVDDLSMGVENDDCCLIAVSTSSPKKKSCEPTTTVDKTTTTTTTITITTISSTLGHTASIGVDYAPSTVIHVTLSDPDAARRYLTDESGQWWATVVTLKLQLLTLKLITCTTYSIHS
ncbi:hypothetical protein U3516DRAFT_764312 [Neocallimastix sp. 'constans']